VSSKIIFLKNGKDIDEDLMANAMKYLKNKTKKEIINTALSNYVQHQMQLKILLLQGKVKWIGISTKGGEMVNYVVDSSVWIDFF
jgi:hypothetical protein